ncbi:MAG: hypothetical protein Q8P67_21405 [archaeon]|nr:hypothetical protein [archaeon]
MVKDDPQEVAKEVRRLIGPLSSLFVTSPETVLRISEVADPSVPEEYRYGIVASMLVLPDPAAAALASPPGSAAARMLGLFRACFELLGRFSRQALLALSSQLAPPDGPPALLEGLQAFLRDCRVLDELHAAVLQSPPHMRHYLLLQKDASLHRRMELLHLLADLFSLGGPEFASFHAAFSRLDQASLALLCRLALLPYATLDIMALVLHSAAHSQEPHSFSSSSSSSSSSFVLPSLPSPLSSSPSSSFLMGHPSPLYASPLHPSDDLPLFDDSLDSHSLFNIHLLNSPLSDDSSRLPEATSQHHLSDLSYSQSFAYSSILNPHTSRPIRIEVTPPLLADSINPSSSPSSSSSSAHVQPDDAVLLSSRYRLRLLRQPPASAVADKMLKPSPLLHIECPSGTPLNTLFVEASLVRSDTRAEIVRGITGVTTIAFNNGATLSFDKLKVHALRSQMGTTFQLRFILKRHTKHAPQTLHDVSALSHDIDVVENNSLRRNPLSRPPAAFDVLELVPSSAPPGAEFVILSRAVVPSLVHHLVLRLGDAPVPFYLHDPGVLVCTVPDLPPGTRLPLITILNDVHKVHSTFVFQIS